MTDNGAPKGQLFDLTPVDGSINDSAMQTQRIVRSVLQEQEERLEKKRADEREAERKEREAAHKRRVKWGGIIAGVITTILGGGGLTLSMKSDDTPPIMPSDLKNDVKKALDKGEENQRQIRALGRVTVEGFDFVVDKIDKAHPEVAGDKKPKSLEDAEQALEDENTDRKVDEALDIVKSVTGGNTDGL